MKNPKRKGSDFERWAVKFFKALGFQAMRAPASLGYDIMVQGLGVGELKARRNSFGALYRALQGYGPVPIRVNGIPLWAVRLDMIRYPESPDSGINIRNKLIAQYFEDAPPNFFMLVKDNYKKPILLTQNYAIIFKIQERAEAMPWWA